MIVSWPSSINALKETYAAIALPIENAFAGLVENVLLPVLSTKNISAQNSPHLLMSAMAARNAINAYLKNIFTTLPMPKRNTYPSGLNPDPGSHCQRMNGNRSTTFFLLF